jgi:hypothetical protein
MLRVCANPSFTAQACRQSKRLFQDSSRRIYSSTSLQSTRNVATKTNHHWQAATLLGTLVICTWKIVTPPLKSAKVTKCEAKVLRSPLPEPPKIVVKVDETDLWNKVKRILRMMRRMVKLTIALAPVLALYPLQLLLHHRRSEDEDARDIVHLSLLEQNNEIPDGPIGWYYKMCLHCVEWSGAACIKIMQWASSRPDIFGPVFCTVFSRLQDDTTPHAWKHTEKALLEAYGEDWKKHVRLDEILGSGCIAQV